jgi:hypothetical protein
MGHDALVYEDVGAGPQDIVINLKSCGHGL